MNLVLQKGEKQPKIWTSFVDVPKAGTAKDIWRKASRSVRRAAAAAKAD